jgi:hypothetical protein
VTGTPKLELADRLALAIVEHGPLGCGPLARVVRARDVDVRRELHADSRFVHAGAGRGSRWWLVLPAVSARDGKGRVPGAGLGSDDGLSLRERVAALERRVAELERQLEVSSR